MNKTPEVAIIPLEHGGTCTIINTYLKDEKVHRVSVYDSARNETATVDVTNYKDAHWLYSSAVLSGHSGMALLTIELYKLRPSAARK